MQPDAGFGFVGRRGQRVPRRQRRVGSRRIAGGEQRRPGVAQRPPLQRHGRQRLGHGGLAADARGFGIGLDFALPGEVQADRQEARHVPGHEQPQRRAGEAPAPVQPAGDFLPLQAREIHAAGVAAMTLRDVGVFMRQDGAAGRWRQHVEQRQPQPQDVAGLAAQPAVLADGGVEFAVEIDRIQRRRGHRVADAVERFEQAGRVVTPQRQAFLAGVGGGAERRPEHDDAGH